jgi:molybdenum cofactor cytidylyltransferase
VPSGRPRSGPNARISGPNERIGRRSAVGLILLAAGGSVRMGRPKQLLPVSTPESGEAGAAPAESLLRHATRVAVEAALRPAVVVLGAHSDALVPHIADLPVHILAHSGWQRGIGSSIKAGVECVTALAPALDAIMIVVCDQPHLSAGVLRRLLRTYRGSAASIVASAYAGTIGVPAIIDRSLDAELRALGDRDSARRIINRDPSRTSAVPFPLGAVDIDTPDAYAAYLDARRPAEPSLST